MGKEEVTRVKIEGCVAAKIEDTECTTLKHKTNHYCNSTTIKGTKSSPQDKMTTAQQQVPLLSSSYDEDFNFKTTDTNSNLIKHSSTTTTSKPWWRVLTVGGTQFDAFMMEGE